MRSKVFMALPETIPRGRRSRPILATLGPARALHRRTVTDLTFRKEFMRFCLQRAAVAAVAFAFAALGLGQTSATASQTPPAYLLSAAELFAPEVDAAATAYPEVLEFAWPRSPWSPSAMIASGFGGAPLNGPLENGLRKLLSLAPTSEEKRFLRESLRYEARAA